VTADPRTGDIIRIDRLVRGTGNAPGEVIEIRPMGPHAEKMRSLIRSRTAAVAREIPNLPAGYNSTIVEYTPRDVLDYLLDAENMPPADAVELMRLYGFKITE
jgi:hypothetical protein